MDKLENYEAEALFEELANSMEEVAIINYGEKETPIKVLKRIPVGILNTMIDMIVEIALSDGAYNHVKREMAVAVIVVKYLTNVPTKMITLEDGTEEEDFDMYYQLVFGEDGLYDNPNTAYVIGQIEGYIDNAVAMRVNATTPVNRLCSRILQLGAEVNSTIDDMVNNPEKLEALLGEFLKTQNKAPEDKSVEE